MREWGVRDLVALLRENWILILVCTLLGLVPPWWAQRDRFPIYRAEALIEQKQETTPLAELGLARVRVDQYDLGSQRRVMRSQRVLAPVVDSLGLRLEMGGPSFLRSTVATDIVVEPEAASGTFELLRDGGAIRLRDPASGEVVSSSAPGQWLFGPGFAMWLREDAALDEPVRVRIIGREAAIGAVRGGVRVEQVPDTYLFQITFTHPDPVTAAGVVNAMALEYQLYDAEQDRSEIIRRREFLAEQMASISDSLAAEQGRLHGYQSDGGLTDPTAGAQALTGQLIELQADLRKLRFDEGVLVSALASIDSGDDADQAFQRIVALGASLVPAATTLAARLGDLESQRQGLTVSRYGYTESQPQVERLDSLISITRSEMRQAAGQSLALLRERRASAEDLLEELRGQVEELPGQLGPYARQQQRVRVVQQMFNTVAGRFYESQVEAAVETGGVEIVDPALVPSTAIPTQTRYDFGLVVGLAVGLGLAYLRQQLSSTIRTVEELRAASGLEVLAVIPIAPRGGGAHTRPVPVLEDGFPAGMEAFRNLRTMLRFARADRLRVVGITSADPGAGKTTVALNLAASIAQQGGRVLLVDADLRKPVQHLILETAREPGLTDVIVEEVELSAAVQPLQDRLSGVGDLWVLPAGTIVPNPAELLGSARFPALLRELGEQFETVIVDTAPVLAVSDAAVVGTCVDGMVVVAVAEDTHEAALAEAVQRLRQVGVPLVGAVLNKVPTGSGRYGYYRGDYSGYYQQPSGNGHHGGAVRNRLRRLLGARR